VDPNLKDNIKRTLLLFAAINGYDRIVITLLANENIDLDPKDYYSLISLFIVVRYSRIEVVKLLLDTRRVDIDLRGCFERTPL